MLYVPIGLKNHTTCDHRRYFIPVVQEILLVGSMRPAHENLKFDKKCRHRGRRKPIPTSDTSSVAVI